MQLFEYRSVEKSRDAGGPPKPRTFLWDWAMANTDGTAEADGAGGGRKLIFFGFARREFDEVTVTQRVLPRRRRGRWNPVDFRPRAARAFCTVSRGTTGKSRWSRRRGSPRTSVPSAFRCPITFAPKFDASRRRGRFRRFISGPVVRDKPERVARSPARAAIRTMPIPQSFDRSADGRAGPLGAREPQTLLPRHMPPAYLDYAAARQTSRRRP